ncbi:endonuclease domain-containing protein [Streptomyces albus]|uniref:endonuclease domain-containing protein n=1 Tax=Streptomyces albus TaxID=1888 RepID=UPI0033F2AFD5
MPTLDDLPPYRRARLLWEFAHFGLHEVERMVQEATGRCQVPRLDGARPHAVLGDDGLFHLADGSGMICAPHYGAAEPVLSGEGIDTANVPREQQCRQYGKESALHHWPPPPARTAAVRRMRAALVAALGPHCHLCGRYPGAMVDHDHETGLVRGLLCALCNRSLEHCPHVDGCPKADYMAQPPAAHLGLTYPKHLEWKPTAATRARVIGYLGFDPYTDWPPRGDTAWISPGAQSWFGDQREEIF